MPTTTRRLRVLHLITSAFEAPWTWKAGDPVSRLMWPLGAIFRHTDRDRFDLFIGSMVPPTAEVGRIPGLQLRCVPSARRSTHVLAAIKLAHWLKANRIDVVQTHLFDAGIVGLLAARLAGTPVAVATGHHSHEFAVTPPSFSSVVDGICTAGLATHVIVPSRFMRQTLLDLYRMPEARVVSIPHGLDPERLTAAPGAGARIRQELGLQGKIVLGAAGRLYWIKRYDILLRAFADAARHMPEAVLLIAGTGGDRESLEGLARELGVADRVRFLGLRADIIDILAAIDLFVHPALTESFGLVLIEAMAAGKPALTTSVGIAPEVLADGEAGTMVAPGDQAAFSAALGRLLANRARWPAMGKRAREIAQTFTAPTMVAAYEAHYAQWVAAAGSRP
jgi:glycosyltransferase involved in cell wall biosynthesis